jgi:branched-subunit amino acid aminotransferase/4-amino-4-deoxychorismate lyase
MKTYVNGQWYAEAEASISVQDRGFRFGDGVFESILIHHGRLCWLSRHLQRLSEGLNALKIATPQENLAALAAEALRRNPLQEGVLRIAVSRGIGSRGYLPMNLSSPSVVIETLWMPPLVNRSIRLWLSSYRRISPSQLPTAHKIAQGVNSTLARLEAAENSCDEALMLSAEGSLSEAASACLFWSDNAGNIYTPSLPCGALAGIGRALLLENLPVTEGEYPLEALREASGVILVSAVTGIRNVVKLQPQGWEWQDTTLQQRAEEAYASCLLKEC